jgi:uncharacterized protein YciI
MSNYRKTMTEALQEMVSLDERMRMPRQLIDTNKEVMIVKKNKVIVIDKKDQDKYMKQGWELAEEVGLNEGTIDKVKEIASKKQAMKIDGVMVDSFTASAISQIYDKVNDANKKKMDKLPITKLASLAMKMMQKNEFVPEGKMRDYIVNPVQEELEQGKPIVIEEGKMGDQWQKGAKSVKSGPFELMRGKSGVHAIMQNGKKLGDFSYDDDADNFVANMKGMKGQWVGNDIDSLINHLQKVHKEEVELDEKVKEYKGVAYFKDRKDAEAHMKKFAPKGRVREYDRGYAIQTKIAGPYLNKSGKVEEQVEIEEASAAADARRAMRADPDMRQKFSKDVSATDDDVKGASKNIMMQMRKAQSLNGRFDVEFADGKKVKIPAKMAIAVQSKYNKMRRPAEKEKFQAKIAKSYRDMLSALKEAVSPAQQAAIAISKKERGEKPKKESVLDRIDKKIKEKNDG